MIQDVIQKARWSIPSVLENVQRVTQRLVQFIERLGLTHSDLFDVRLCFEESLINAIKYGNGEKRQIPVTVEIAYNDREIYISVEDQGKGFDPCALKDPTDERNLDQCGGRGVFIIRHLMDRVAYNPKGNRVEMVKVYRKSHSSPPIEKGKNP